jgi:alginate O-acetyltransferase complex protein AlgI
MPQFAERTNKRPQWDNLAAGLFLLTIGLVKKVLIADTFAPIADAGFAAPATLAAPAAWAAVLAYTMQIYFDFSGYTDMARGLGQMMGFKFMRNFNNPYVATGLGDFWNRWHISLSTWFKDYVYFPLGGNRGTTFQTYRNMVITMLISGIWHGAAWGFVIWGALHAIGRVVTRNLEMSPFYRERFPKFAKQMGVFVFVCFTWIFFRGQTWGGSWAVLSRIFTTEWTDPKFPMPLLALVLAVWIYQFLYTSEGAGRRMLDLAPVRVGLSAAMLVWLAVIAQSGNQAFIYFQF